MSGLISLVTGESRDGWIYRLDPRTKIVALLACGTAVVSLDAPRHLLILLLLALGGHMGARFSAGKYKLTVVVLLLGLWGVTLSQALFFREWPRTVMATLIPDHFPVLGQLTGGLYLYQEGFEHGLTQGLRLAAMTGLGLLVAWTTAPRDLLLGLIRLKMPYGLAFMLTTAVRFLPQLTDEIGTVVAVQRLRGVNPVRVSGKSVTHIINLLTPVLANAVKRAATLGASCESRAFNPLGPRTALRELRFRWADQLLIGVLAMLSGLLLAVKSVFWLYQAELICISGWRWVYQLARAL
jgi:energy-coupling factor transport system permease protein